MSSIKVHASDCGRIVERLQIK